MIAIINTNKYKITKTTKQSAGYDLYSPINVIIKAHDCAVIDTGISIAYTDIREDLLVYAQIKGRSGLSINNSIEVGNAGVIDMDYRGTIKVKLYNHSDINYKISKGDRIAQLIFFTLPNIGIKIINNKTQEFADMFATERGTNGLGSSGK